jgi:hypothetical protein
MFCEVCNKLGVRAAGKCNTCYVREWRRTHPEMSRNNDLKSNFGITLAEYADLLTQQDGVCALCGQTERTRHNKTERRRNLAVDHCHTTGEVRGLLCSQCNQGLGNFRDDVGLLAKAIAYLKSRGV